MTNFIEGRLGGKKAPAPHVPREDPDSLRSRATGRVVDLLCEGEIVGLVDGAQSIYLDDTPLQNPDNSFNFENVHWEFRAGTPDQDYIKGFPAVENTVQVGVEVTADNAVVRTIGDVDAARIVIGIPRLTNALSNGDLVGSTVEYLIDAKLTEHINWTNVAFVKVTGKTTSPYERATRVERPEGDGEWQVRVTRFTPDSTTGNLSNQTLWNYFVTIVDHRFQYNDSALIGISVDAEQFGSFPRRAYLIDGLKIQVPTNYDPIARTYSGVWNGAFKTAWSNNPAWCLYDLLTNDRYGLGEFVDPASIDKFGLYEIGQYCDQLVDDGAGGQEPRFTFNACIGTREEAFKVVQLLSSAFRGMIFYASGAIMAVADMPSDPIKLVTPANVQDGVFNYSGTSQKARHTRAIVWWNDPEDQYRRVPAIWDDGDAIARYGLRPIEIDAFGCTSRGQATRLGKWILDSEFNEDQTISYRTGFDHADVFPGSIIAVQDPLIASVQFSGRIVAATSTSVTLDRPVDLAPGETYTLSLISPDDSTVVERAVSSPSGASHTTLQTADWGFVPMSNSVWVLTGSDVAPRLFRVLANREIERGEWEIVALLHDPNKYLRVEQGLRLDPNPISRQTLTQPLPPSHLDFEQTYTIIDGVRRRALDLSWQASPSDFVSEYVVDVRYGDGNFFRAGRSSTTNFEFLIARDGFYTVRVYAVNIAGSISPALEETLLVDETGTSALDPVGALRLRDFAPSTLYEGQNIVIAWDPPEAVANTIPFLYRVEVYDHDDNILLRSFEQSGATYTYDFTTNRLDNGGTPKRTIRFEVRAIDNLGRETAEVALVADNPAPALPANPVLTPFGTFVRLTHDGSPDADWQGTIVWGKADDSSGAVDPIPALEIARADINAQVIDIPLPDGPHLIRYALFDTFGPYDLIPSAVETVQTVSTEVDFDTPDQPTDLTVTSRVETTPSGRERVMLEVFWAEVTSALTHYEVGLTEELGGEVVFYAAGPYFELEARANTTYHVRVRAVNATAKSAFTATVDHLTAADDQPPAPPTDLTATTAIRSGHFSWVNPADPDLSHVEVWLAATNDRADAVKEAEVKTTFYWLRDLAPLTTRYGWVRAVDTSGNVSEWEPAGPTDGVALTTKGVDGAVDIAADSITADQIAAAAITADELAANSVTSVKVAAEGIEAGKILVSGSTFLSDWRQGGDETEIAGGRIAANTISANKLEIGSRNIHFDVSFSTDATTQTASWAAGSVAWVDDDGAKTTTALAAGSVVWTSGLVHIYWVKGAGALATSTDQATAYGADRIVIGTYSGDNRLIVTYGLTTIDGDRIIAGTIAGSKIQAQTIEANQLAANAVTADKIAASAVTADKINAGAVTTDKLAANSVTSGKIAANQITATHLTTGTLITNSAQISTAAITQAHIANLKVNNGNFDNLTIRGEVIEQNGITFVNRISRPEAFNFTYNQQHVMISQTCTNRANSDVLIWVSFCVRPSLLHLLYIRIYSSQVGTIYEMPLTQMNQVGVEFVGDGNFNPTYGGPYTFIGSASLGAAANATYSVYVQISGWYGFITPQVYNRNLMILTRSR